MMRTLSLLPKLVTVLVLLCAGCASLVYERAAIDKGFTVDVSANGSFEFFADVGNDDEGGIGTYGLAPGLRVEMREGFSDRFGIFGRLGADYAPGVKSTPRAQYCPLDVDFLAGVKVAPFRSRSHSLRFAVGVPNLIEAKYLFDLGDRWTLDAGVGAFSGLSLGAAYHVPLSHAVTMHIAAQAGATFINGLVPLPSGSLGVALGFPR